MMIQCKIIDMHQSQHLYFHLSFIAIHVEFHFRLVNLNPSSLEIQSSIGKYEALDSHQSTSLQLWSTSHSRCDFGPFKSDAASAPYLTSLIMSSSLLARQLERSSYNKEIIKSHESFSKQNNDDHIQRNIFSGRSATALPCCLECLPSSPNINT